MKRGKFIVIEGGEGSGKTSVMSFLKEKFANRNDLVFTREPGGTGISEKIRNLLMDKNNKDILPITEIFLFCGARAQHVMELISPSLLAGKNVISDRFDASTVAYQLFGRGKVELMADFLKLNAIAKNEIEPNAVIWLDVDPETGLRRKERSEEGKSTRFDEEKLEFHRRVRSGFQSFLKQEWIGSFLNSDDDDCEYCKEVWHRIDTNTMSLGEVKNETFEIVSKILNS